ncbi:MAG: glycosyltransferase [bacterium]
MRLIILIGIIIGGCIFSPFIFLKTLWNVSVVLISIQSTWLCFYTIVALLLFKKQTSVSSEDSFQPKISVIIPVHNEEKVITSTINSILRSNYPREKLEIIVVNDASTDGTKEICEELVRKGIISLINRSSFAERGKAVSLNEALTTIKDEIICLIDADNEVSPNFFNRLVQHFQDPEVALVHARVKSKNPNTNLLTKLIDIEFTALYLTYLLPKAYLELNFGCMGPGELIRTSVAKEIGGFNNNLATEDVEFTYRVQQYGYKIIYDPYECTYNELVYTLKDYWHQRYRWMLGSIQAFIAHFPGFYLNKKINLRKKIDFTNTFFIIGSLIALDVISGIHIIDILTNFNLLILYLPLGAYIGITLFWTGTAMFIDNRLKKEGIFVLLMPWYFFLVAVPTLKATIDEYILKKRYLPQKATHLGLQGGIKEG